MSPVRIPWLIPFCAALLLAVGLSAIARGDQLMGGPSLGNRQAVWGGLACLVMLAATLFPYRALRWWSFPLYTVTLGLLVAVLSFPPRNGSRSWMRLGFADFQPSELSKLAFILALSRYLMYRRNHRHVLGLIVPFLLAAVPVALILKEPDLGTSLLFFPMLFSMLFAAGAKWRHLAIVLVFGVAMSPVMWKLMNAEQRSRITSVLRQHDGATSEIGDDERHLHQAKQMLALGGVWGSELMGEAVSDPTAYRLPVARSDFAFCLVGERWGLAGTLGILCLFGILIGRGLKIAASTEEPFGRLIAVGIVTQLAAQVVINTGMTVGLLPITGLPLPLVSYGGSSLVTTGLSLGILLNVGLRPTYEITGDPFRFQDA